MKNGFYKSDYNYFVADEGDGIYNIFPYDDFDASGWHFLHEGEEGYRISDFDIIFETNDFEEAVEFVNKLEGYEN